MAVAKKDQERVGYARMYGQQARNDGKGRAVPKYWAEHADRLAGFDGVPIGGEPKPVIEGLEAELDEGAVMKGD